jgi:hypothetical protein
MISPDGREVLIFTTITFAQDDAEDAVRKLRKSLRVFADEDSEDDTVRFAWTREYPKDRWSPLSRLGGRQSLGSVEISKAGAPTAQAKRLSMAPWPGCGRQRGRETERPPCARWRPRRPRAAAPSCPWRVRRCLGGDARSQVRGHAEHRRHAAVPAGKLRRRGSAARGVSGRERRQRIRPCLWRKRQRHGGIDLVQSRLAPAGQTRRRYHG